MHGRVRESEVTPPSAVAGGVPPWVPRVCARVRCGRVQVKAVLHEDQDHRPYAYATRADVLCSPLDSARGETQLLKTPCVAMACHAVVLAAHVRLPQAVGRLMARARR